jgi:predicted nucleotidyltransferase
VLTHNDIRAIAWRITRKYAPGIVGIFGSYAIGRAHDKSDLDLFVIKTTTETRMARRKRVRAMLVDVSHPLDIHVFTPEEFEEAAHEEFSFIATVALQARILYSTGEFDSKLLSLSTALNRYAQHLEPLYHSIRHRS